MKQGQTKATRAGIYFLLKNMGRSTFKYLCAVATGVLLVNTVSLGSPQHFTAVHLRWDLPALAKSSGGRTSGGSLRRTSPSRSPGSQSSPSHPENTSPSSPQLNPSPDYRGPVIVPVPLAPPVYRQDPYYNRPYSGTSTTSSGANWIVGLIVLGLSAAAIVAVVYFVMRSRRNRAIAGSTTELENDIVTVSKLQVALLAEARDIQAQLTHLSLGADPNMPEGLQHLLQECVLALLRSPENWSHVLASSTTLKSREEAEMLFNRLSIAERSKFSVETLTNVGGNVRKQDLKLNADHEPASYIVVTLMLGTAHDQPLFGDIRTVAALQESLETLASCPADYLLAFELLWSPQDASHSLTYDELLSEYTDMVQI
jgi:uncharacterized membrane protein